MCGGGYSSGKCYTYNSETDTWVARGSLPAPVGFAGASYHKTLGLIMTGGRGAPTSDLLVATTDGRNFQTTKLPGANKYHCQVLVDDNTLMVLGTGSQAYTINLSTWNVTTVANMPGGAIHHVCGLGTKSTGEKVVVVAGAGGNRAETYLFDVQTETWKIGTPIK